MQSKSSNQVRVKPPGKSITDESVSVVLGGKFTDVTHVDHDWFKSEIIRLTPSNASGAYKFKFTYLADSLLSKLYIKGVSDPIRLKEAALASFEIGERDCAVLNESGLTVDRSTLERARSVISRILGPFSYEKVLLSVKHGSGATQSRPRAFGQPHNKYAVDNGRKYFSRKRKKYIRARKSLSVTPLAYPIWAGLSSIWPGLARDGNNVYLVRGNTLDTVPKNSKTDRTIAKEPDVNMFLQLGVGDYLARRLTMFKNSKFDQSRNQLLARLGSRYGHLATLDLSRASDSLSFKLVYELLPPEWVDYLDAIRSHYYVDPTTGKYRRYEKFCTMGNGFCFELQTIIFLGLVLASCEGSSLQDVGNYYSTYGDDIICPSMHAHEVVKTLKGCGFTINPDKSFVDGPFRESCGKHYYHGFDVTPFYIRKPIDSVHRVCWLLNSLRKWAFDEDACVCDDTVYQLWSRIYKQFPVLRRLRGGRDVNRTDYVVSPGRPASRLVARTKRLTLDEEGAYLCKLNQGLISTDKLPEMYLLDDNVIFDCYHYTIHPESSDYEVIGAIRNNESELQPSDYMFLTEIQ